MKFENVETATFNMYISSKTFIDEKYVHNSGLLVDFPNYDSFHKLLGSWGLIEIGTKRP